MKKWEFDRRRETIFNQGLDRQNVCGSQKALAPRGAAKGRSQRIIGSSDAAKGVETHKRCFLPVGLHDRLDVDLKTHEASSALGTHGEVTSQLGIG